MGGYAVTAEEFDYLVPYLRALCQGKKVERKFMGEPDDMWGPCHLVSMISMGVAPGRQFRIIEPPLECWVNAYTENGLSIYGSKEQAEKAWPEATYFGRGVKPIRIAVHMREVIE